MKPRKSFRSRNDGPAPVKVKRAPGTPTKSQRRAAAAAEMRSNQQRWRSSLIAEAGKTWSKLHAQELGKVEGNVHVLAGLVQMRYQLSRDESNQQVQAFFAKHAPAAAGAAGPASA